MWNTRFIWHYRHVVIYCPRWITRVLSINHIITSFSAFTPFSVEIFPFSTLIWLEYKEHVFHIELTNDLIGRNWAELWDSMSSEDVMAKLFGQSIISLTILIKYQIWYFSTCYAREPLFLAAQSADKCTQCSSRCLVAISKRKIVFCVKYVV